MLSIRHARDAVSQLIRQAADETTGFDAVIKDNVGETTRGPTCLHPLARTMPLSLAPKRRKMKHCKRRVTKWRKEHTEECKSSDRIKARRQQTEEAPKSTYVADATGHIYRSVLTSPVRSAASANIMDVDGTAEAAIATGAAIPPQVTLMLATADGTRQEPFPGTTEDCGSDSSSDDTTEPKTADECDTSFADETKDGDDGALETAGTLAAPIVVQSRSLLDGPCNDTRDAVLY